VIKPAPPPVVAVPAPAPAPAPAPVVVAPAVVAAPVIAAPSPAPAPKPAPIVAPAPVAKPAPTAPPRQDVALAAPSPAAAAAAAAPAPIAMDARLIEGIFHCLSPGLPQDWKKAWIEITDSGGGKEKSSKFFFTNQYGDDEGEPLTPCSAQAITRSILSLDDKLPADRRAWSRARLVIDSEGDYELSYDYAK
jgi:hypothetical protein